MIVKDKSVNNKKQPLFSQDPKSASKKDINTKMQKHEFLQTNDPAVFGTLNGTKSSHFKAKADTKRIDNIKGQSQREA